MHEHDSSDRRPSCPRLVRNSLQAWHDLFLVGLVFQLLYAGSIRCVVARRPTEEDHRAAVRPDSPFRGETDGQLVLRQSQPRLACRRWLHGRIVREPGAPSLRPGPSLSFAACHPTTRVTTKRRCSALRCRPTIVCGGILRSSVLSTELGAVTADDDDRRSGSTLWGVAVVAGLVGAALSLGVVAVVGGFQSKVVEKPVVEKVPVRAVAEVASAPSGVVGVTRAVAPSIVRLQVTTGNGSTIGSGVMFRDDGYLVTDAHLLQSASAVQAMLADGRSVPATVVGSDGWSAVAVVKVDAGQVPVATFGSAAGLQIGQTAIAIGAPEGSSGGPSVTVGVVSALGKQVDSLDGVSLRDMIETDAAATPDSSGGALSDTNGVLIGLVTTVAQPDGANLDFAAPIDVVRSVAEDIIATGTARHTWLGVEGARRRWRRSL